MKLTREQIIAIKLKGVKARQKEILRDLKIKGSGGMSDLGEPFTVTKHSSKLSQSDLIRMQRDAGGL